MGFCDAAVNGALGEDIFGWLATGGGWMQWIGSTAYTAINIGKAALCRCKFRLLAFQHCYASAESPLANARQRLDTPDLAKILHSHRHRKSCALPMQVPAFGLSALLREC
jgi:hypothetical protein